MGGEEDAEARGGGEGAAGLVVGAADDGGGGAEEGWVGVVAAEGGDGLHQAGLGGGLAPGGEAAAGRCRAVVRVKGDEDDLVGVPGLHGAGGLDAEGVPVAHGDETAGVEIGESALEGAGLLFGELSQGALAAEDGVVGGGGLEAEGGDEAGEEGADEKGTRRMAGSLKRLTRNGLIEAGLSGPPRLKRTIATFR